MNVGQKTGRWSRVRAFVDTTLGKVQSTRGWIRKSTVLTLDVVLLSFAYLSAIVLRLGQIPSPLPNWTIQSTALIMFLAVIIVPVSGLNRSIWRYASLHDFLIIARTITITLLLHIVLSFLLTRNQDIPRSVPAITWFVAMIYLSMPRVMYRMLKDRWFSGLRRSFGNSLPSIILVGSSDSVEIYLRSLLRDSAPRYHVAGIFEIDSTHTGREIFGVRVLGDVDGISGFLERAEKSDSMPRHIVLMGGDISQPSIRKLMRMSTRFGISLARLPDTRSIEGTRSFEQYRKFRAVQLEDVLGRQSVNTNLQEVEDIIFGKCVLITGAGGSIGSELTRQIAAMKPSRIVLVDNNEFNLFEIDQDILDSYPQLVKSARLCSVYNRSQIAKIVNEERPDLIFHAAALKHVPLVEQNPCQGVQVNVTGTKNVADAARSGGVSAVIIISTDKAVNPTNVMGATKRIAEKYCQALDLENSGDEVCTRFMTVRFGNVLGSAGSVVPFFEKQIARGGPVTVTHPDIERFFMTIREAVELVLQASGYGILHGDERGRIFVLEMGQPVKILEVARQMIRLAGFVPDEDIKILVTGLRPGEKMTEELFALDEPVLTTELDGVLAARARAVDLPILNSLLERLEEAAEANDTEKLLVLMKTIVPEYSPSTEFEMLIHRQTSRDVYSELISETGETAFGNTGKSEKR